MRIFKAHAGPPRRHQPVPFHAAEGELVLPAAGGLPFHFFGLVSRGLAGTSAKVGELEASPLGLASMLLGDDADDVDRLSIAATAAISTLSWIHHFPIGAIVRIRANGQLNLDPYSVSVDWLVDDSVEWAQLQREAGMVPFAAHVRRGWKIGAVDPPDERSPWLVPVDELLALVRGLRGFKSATEVRLIGAGAHELPNGLPSDPTPTEDVVVARRALRLL